MKCKDEVHARHTKISRRERSNVAKIGIVDKCGLNDARTPLRKRFEGAFAKLTYMVEGKAPFDAIKE